MALLGAAVVPLLQGLAAELSSIHSLIVLLNLCAVGWLLLKQNQI
tara:strand:+ start:1486 stop:1620 length:135 start_codon:yes stop_codon:yes gene_type:complete